MDRTTVLEDIFRKSSAIRRAGIPGIELTPEFYSIFDDGTVKTNVSVGFASIGNPKYIVCFAKGPYDWQKNSWHELVAIIDQESKLTNEISLNRWALRDITLYDSNRVDNFRLRLLLDDKSFDVKSVIRGEDLQLSEIWKMLIEIDANCSNEAEAIIYLNYLLKKRKVKTLEFSLEEFKARLSEKNNIINQYKELLRNIDLLVNSKST